MQQTVLIDTFVSCGYRYGPHAGPGWACGRICESRARSAASRAPVGTPLDDAEYQAREGRLPPAGSARSAPHSLGRALCGDMLACRPVPAALGGAVGPAGRA